MAKPSSAEPFGTLDDPSATLQGRIAYRFRKPALLELALTHSSLAFEQGESSNRGAPNLTTEDNEQLEFLAMPSSA